MEYNYSTKKESHEESSMVVQPPNLIAKEKWTRTE